jgi:3-hydroxybutyryl-CoA dehydratase
MSNNVFDLDFDQLHPGEGFVTPARTITESDLVSFASLTGDWHPQHADAAWAADSRFGERIAHGMLVLSYAVGLAPVDPERVVALRGIDGVAFKRPVKIGDTIRLQVRVEEARPLDGELGLVVLAWRVVNQRDELALRARVTALWRRVPRPNGAAANGSAPAAADSSQPPFEEVYL